MALFDIFKKKKGRKEEGREVRYRERTKEKIQQQTETTSETKKDGAPEKEKTTTYASDRAARVLVHPSVTEKSARLAEEGVYTFRVKDDATKNEVRKAVEELYRVHVASVNVSWVRPKRRVLRGVTGTKSGYRKAMVALKAGEKIEFV
ncbi:MAG: 50S ribosomal protein L23 [Candidatus Niyogibacteria bacterium CG10_big_fil_rev_8_21_14_0_10_46_36]|uniref:Large ribosomal subunit protein uL23 n=1 Tax=Candidatus Niyogibacteria bacterium CG10_big_fil_rev_8_21_14_0_10_46_36 TaxID=1974726 RepID=A0A2H0TFP2_9BACT|nr:MAG: 50S ribosomal protein L23 [Candidatus Niyogibacteria bacterium CG10_big_fil_rev_8_21_14_0_10_46_36]